VSVSAGHSSLSTNEQPIHWWLRVPRWLVTTLALLLIALTAVLSTLGPYLVEKWAVGRLRAQPDVRFLSETRNASWDLRTFEKLWGEIRTPTEHSIAFGPTSPRFALSLLTGVRRVKILHLSCRDLRDDDLAIVPKLTGLKNLSLPATSLTAGAFAHLEGLPLDYVGLSDGTVPAGSLKAVSRLPKLTRLYLYRCTFDEQDFASFRNHPRLEWLRAIQVDFCDQDVDTIGSLLALRVLELDHAGVSNAELRRLPETMNLESLSLSGEELTDEGLAGLRVDPGILSIWRTTVSFGEPVEAWLQSRKCCREVRVHGLSLPTERVRHLNALGSARVEAID
jgi:hypothetical protein